MAILGLIGAFFIVGTALFNVVLCSNILIGAFRSRFIDIDWMYQVVMPIFAIVMWTTVTTIIFI